MKPNLLVSYLKKRTKSKTNEQCQSCRSHVDFIPPPSTLYAFHPPNPTVHPHQQPQHHLQPHQHTQAQLQPYPAQVYQPQAIQLPLSPCPHQCLPQHHIIHSPQQTVACSIQGQFRGGSLESRTNDGGVGLTNGQLQTVSSSSITLPSYQSSQIQAISNQSPKCADNPYYSNQMASQILQRQQVQQHQQQLQQQLQQQMEDQRQKEQRQQQQQLQSQYRQQQLEFQHQSLEQQDYQNNGIVEEVTTKDLSLEVLCHIHERSMEDLSKLASLLKEDISKLNEELAIIRNDTPVYSVNEIKI